MLPWQDPADLPPNNPLAELGLSPLLSGILLARGMNSPAQARAFLDPQQAPVARAFDLPDMQQAAARLKLAIRSQEHILVWGDFDVDGQTATATLVESLQSLGANVRYHIPNRERESHGMRPQMLEKLINERQPALILTCDTGSSAHEGITLAKARGVEVIVTDHHELPETLPPADLLINPRFLPAEHPLASLAGVGVAFKLAEALGVDTAPLLDLAALGLVADVALLTGETRRLVQCGLQTLRATTRPGLLAMLSLAGSPTSELNETTIGFTLAPRLNALGRLDDATPAVELLTTRDPARAHLLAQRLEGLNNQRRHLTHQVTQAAESLLRQSPDLLTEPALVLHNPGWPAGIIGIAANVLAERYQKPVILLCGEETLRGSARSVAGIHITAAIAACGLAPNSFGGHPMAAGLSLPAETLPAFRRRLARAIESQNRARAEQGSTLAANHLQIDAWLGWNAPSLELAQEVERAAPFGAGNPPPLFASHSLRLVENSLIGKNSEHRKLLVADETGLEQTLLWWGGALEALPETLFDLAYTLRAGNWAGKSQLTLEVRAWRPTAAQTLEVKTGPTWVDERQNPGALVAWRKNAPESALWAEAEHKTLSGALRRDKLFRAQTLLIWTTPPDNASLQQALDAAQPARVVVFAQNPLTPAPTEFLNQIAGAARFVLNHKAGQTRLVELAAVSGQSEISARWALKWLMACGQLSAEFAPSGQIRLQAASARADEAAKGLSFSNLQKSLQETAAFRAQFVSRPSLGLDAHGQVG